MYMGVIRVTARPYYYAKLEEEKQKQAPEVEVYPSGTISMSFQVGGTGRYLGRMQQKKLRPIISSVLQSKGMYVRDYIGADNLGYYMWDELMLRGNEIFTFRMHITEIEPMLQLIRVLQEQGFYPDDEILITYYPEKTDMDTVVNLAIILDSRKELIEQALNLMEPMQIIVGHGLALSIKLGAFSYTAVEAAAYLLEQACKMARATKKARMKPVDMSNPKFQMRSWLLRLGFIGQQYERPRKTLLDGLSGDAAFFSEEQKARAVARRKARKMSEEVNREPA